MPPGPSPLSQPDPRQGLGPPVLSLPEEVPGFPCPWASSWALFGGV